MKAFQVKEHVHPSKVSVSDIPIPAPDASKGEVLVDIYAAGLNFFDILQSQGKYQTQPPLPFVLGAELAGTISKSWPIPKGCPYKPGDKVFGYAQGTYAEHVVVNWNTLLPVPKGLSFEEAATIPLTTTTSYAALVDRAQAKAGEWVLIHAGAGGVGLVACQIAKSLGCKVIATASSESKRNVCQKYGKADEVVDYTQKDWQKQVMKITSGNGVNVVFDPVGIIIPSLKCVAWNAKLVVVGFAAGSIEKIPANLLLLKQVSVTGVYWGATATKDPAAAAKVIKNVLSLLASGKVKQVIYDKPYVGLDQVSQGLHDIESRKVWGKAVVRIREAKDEEARAKL
ncbi:uncharacterized protein L201_004401 [Kwoniella dendrophila CBS 6074]|uniref:Enoyl reductase (ER) domain-containing protein n=1 Tax=Kwoniella dendrophila CBS 6074 TaxID=1295534 RepID=A0AAX4JVW5_9TREE